MNEPLFTDRQLRLVKTIFAGAAIAFVIGTLVGMTLASYWSAELTNYLLDENRALTAEIESYQ